MVKGFYGNGFFFLVVKVGDDFDVLEGKVCWGSGRFCGKDCVVRIVCSVVGVFYCIVFFYFLIYILLGFLFYLVFLVDFVNFKLLFFFL